MIIISDKEYNHWAKTIAQNAIEKFGNKQVVCSGWGASGVYHIGNSREAVTCNAILLEMEKQGADAKFVMIIDDIDPLNSIPANLKKYSNKLRPYLGHPLNKVPDFTNQYENYAEFFASKMKKALSDFNFNVEHLYASKMYQDGMYDNSLNLYIENEERTQQVIENISGSPLTDLISITCQNCGNGKTTKITGYPAKNKIQYICQTDKMYKGCNHEGQIDIKDHEWKLRWRLDWPARQHFLNITVEPAGKDHSVAGGSIDSSIEIHKQIFGREPPIMPKFEFITIGGKKFSGSKGGALAASEVSSIMPVSAYLFLVYRSDLLKEIRFNPQSLEYASLMDEFDTARKMALGINVEGRDREFDKLSTAANLAMMENERGFEPANIKYAELVLIHQISLRNKEVTIQKIEKMNKFPNELSKIETKNRLDNLENWLDNLAPDNLKFQILEENPKEVSKYWTPDLKKIWISSLQNIDENMGPEDFTAKLRENASKLNTNPKMVYMPFYQTFVGDPRGPNAANLVFALGKEYVIKRINQIKISS